MNPNLTAVTTAAPPPGLHTRQRYVHDLAKTLERLWVYYQAMHHGMPVRISDELLIKKP